jgi:hypothetical protein
MRMNVRSVLVALFGAAILAASGVFAAPALAADIEVDLTTQRPAKCFDIGGHGGCLDEFQFFVTAANTGTTDIPARSGQTGGWYIQFTYPTGILPEAQYNCTIVQAGTCIKAYNTGIRGGGSAAVMIEFDTVGTVPRDARITFRGIPGGGYVDRHSTTVSCLFFSTRAGCESL